MSESQQHIIRRQNLKVSAVTADAFALKRKVESLVADLAPRLDDMFNDITTKDEWLKIDSLDIEVDGISEEELYDKLIDRILQSMKVKIAARKDELSSAGSPGNKDGKYFASVHHRNIYALICFLDHGILPWWYGAADTVDFDNRLADSLRHMIQVERVSERNKVFEKLRISLKSSNATTRLLGQFNDDLFLLIIEWFVLETRQAGFDDVRNVFVELNAVFAKGSKSSAAVALVAKTKLLLLLGLLYPGAGREGAQGFIGAWLISVWREVRLLKNVQLSGLFLNTQAIGTFFPALSGSIAHAMVSLADGLNQAEVFLVEIFAAINENLEWNTGESRLEETGKRDKTNKRELTEEASAEKDNLSNELKETDGAIVSNAGLILVAPFLPELFRQCGILEENKIRDINRAIALTHYISYGNCKYREYDVLLNKVLCGAEEGQPIKIIKSISKFEKDEVKMMLEHLIAYWTVLKGTSVEGLREGFLLRTGKLLPQYDEWFLHVEKKTIDVLVQQLPWTIGMIKQPWMTKMLRTEWV